MPKAKPDQVIVHRLELQQTERDTLEAALAGQFVSNTFKAGGEVLKGIGAALAPFQGALTALAAVWIADRSWEDIKDKVLDPIIDVIQTPILATYAPDYALIVAWLNTQYSTDGWNFLDQDYSSHEAFMNTSEGVSTLWRGNYEDSFVVQKLGPLPIGTYEWVSATYSRANSQYQMPGWLVDRFDMYIYTLKQSAVSPEMRATKPPAQWWVQFYPYAEFENEIIWNAKNR